MVCLPKKAYTCISAGVQQMCSLLPNSKGINSFCDMDTTVEVIRKICLYYLTELD